MAALVLRPSAKINLSLHVGARRPDGYHDVRTILQSIALHDVMRIEPSRGPFVIKTTAAHLPVDRTNLVWRAADALWRAMRREGEPQHATVTIDKKIPIGAGLGGGSANAAAALVGLHSLWKGRLTVADLARLGATLGADVPFFLMGGTAIGVGRGDEVYPLIDGKRLGVVLIQPPFGVSTPDAYRWFDEAAAAGDESDAATVPASAPLGWSLGPVPVVNDLQAPVAARHPVIADMLWACRSAGAHAVAMTGSGSVVFGLFEEGAVPKAVKELARKSGDWTVLATRTLSRREAVRRIGL